MVLDQKAEKPLITVPPAGAFKRSSSSRPPTQLASSLECAYYEILTARLEDDRWLAWQPLDWLIISGDVRRSKPGNEEILFTSRSTQAKICFRLIRSLLIQFAVYSLRCLQLVDVSKSEATVDGKRAEWEKKLENLRRKLSSPSRRSPALPVFIFYYFSLRSSVCRCCCCLRNICSDFKKKSSERNKIKNYDTDTLSPK